MNYLPIEQDVVRGVIAEIDPKVLAALDTQTIARHIAMQIYPDCAGPYVSEIQRLVRAYVRLALLEQKSAVKS
jgi:hypothetical protein